MLPQINPQQDEINYVLPPMIQVVIGDGDNARIHELQFDELFPNQSPGDVSDTEILERVGQWITDAPLPRNYVVNRATRASDGVESLVIGPKPEYGYSA